MFKIKNLKSHVSIYYLDRVCILYILFVSIGVNAFQNIPEHTYSPPEQYFNTPIPMQVDEFDKFLKKHDIDVASVMAPLSIPVPQSVKSWKSKNKVISKASNRNVNDLKKCYGKLFHNLYVMKCIES